MTEPNDPNERQLATLRAVAADGGQPKEVSAPGADQWRWEGWLIAESDTGYGLTIDRKALMRRLF